MENENHKGGKRAVTAKRRMWEWTKEKVKEMEDEKEERKEAEEERKRSKKEERRMGYNS